LYSPDAHQHGYDKTPVRIKPILHLGKKLYGETGNSVRIKFEAGAEKLYPVRDIKNFISCVLINSDVSLGKGFTLRPSIHRIYEEDVPVLDFLAELYECDCMMIPNDEDSVFTGTALRLTDGQLRRFLDIFRKASVPVNLSIPGKFKGSVEVKGDYLSFDFRLEMEDKDFILAVGSDEVFIPLTEAKDLIISGDAIYRLSINRLAELKPFIVMLETFKENRFKFVAGDRERFVSEVLPFVDAAGILEIDEAAASLIEKNECLPEIYLDREKGIILADVKFNYGQKTINPFAPTKKSSEMIGGDGPILVRDVRRENEILDILAESDFIVKNNRINLSGDNNVYHFIMYVLPRLQRLADVFYSEDFMSSTLRKSMKYKLGFKIREGAGLLDIEFDFDDISPEEIISILADLREKKKYHKLANGVILNLDDGQIVRLSDMITFLGLTESDIMRKQANAPAFRALYLDDCFSGGPVGLVSRDRLFRDMVSNVKNPSDTEFEIPPGIKGRLREYQATGFKWIKALSNHSLGGILADDMGLGKTLQVLTALMYEKENSASNGAPSLVVVPTSLVYNWCEEITKFAPTLRYMVISGTKNIREKKIQKINNYDVIITSYPLIRMDYTSYAETEFNYCILDEAQYIKNPDSQNAQCVKFIKSRHRFALTGTPIENSITDLWSLFDFVLPGYLHSRTKFYEIYARRLPQRMATANRGSAATYGRSAVAHVEPDAADGRSADTHMGSAAEADEAADMPPRAYTLQEISRQTRPFILRRLKADVLDELPDKIEMKLPAELDAKQKKVYLAHLALIRKDFLEGGDDSDIRHRIGQRQMDVLAALMRLRQICCHPALFVENYDGDSGKFLLLQEVVREAVDGGHRVLIFSQFIGMLSLIKGWAEREGIGYFYLDGQTPPEDRMKNIRKFNGGERELFLLSLKAGGAGINLTGADMVIHYDPWWNPAVEDQATDRAHRIGQKKTVQVIKLVTAGTIEEKIFDLQDRKKQLINDIIKPGETFLSKITIDELRELMS